MEIVVLFKKIWGKSLYYPISDDAKWLTRFTERPTLLKYQLKMAQEKGWKVSVQQESVEEDFLDGK